MDHEWPPWTPDKLADNDQFVNYIIRANPVKKLNKGEVIYRQGQDGEIFYLLLEGRVEVSLVNHEGRKKIICIHEPRCLFAETILDGYQYLVTATCLTPVKVAAINRSSVLNWDIHMLMALVNTLCWKSRINILQLAEQTFDEVGERVEDLLLGLGNKFGTSDSEGVHVELPLTHQLIADIVGSSRVRVSQALGEMTKKRRLAMSKHKFIIYNEKSKSI